MPDKKEETYNTSIIIEHNLTLDLFEVLTKWLKTLPEFQGLEAQINFEKDALLNNPSFRFINPEGESIKIDNVRKFNQELSYAGYNNKKRYIVFFNADSITLQAQNAALKSIEEPPANTQIILLTPTLDKLLPTIISRCKVVSLKKSSTQKSQFEKAAKEYAKITKSKHYELIELSNTYKERSAALSFFNELLSYLHYELHNNKSSYKKEQLTKHLGIILKTIEQLNQNVNVKLVTENCLFDLI